MLNKKRIAADLETRVAIFQREYEKRAGEGPKANANRADGIYAAHHVLCTCTIVLVGELFEDRDVLWKKYIKRDFEVKRAPSKLRNSIFFNEHVTIALVTKNLLNHEKLSMKV